VTIEYRAIECELRASETQGKRIVEGYAVPYDTPTRITPSLTERFARGVFNHQSKAMFRVLLRDQHSNGPSLALGYGVSLEDRPDGAYVALRMSSGPIGDMYYELAREGALYQWSAGFVHRPRHVARDPDGTLVYKRADLFEIAWVPQGAYGELAAVAAVRHKVETPRRDNWHGRFRT